MKPTLRSSFVWIAVLMVAMLALAGCSGNSMIPGGKTVVGNTYTLLSGYHLDSDLTVMGGSATLQPDSSVNGNVSVMGGNLDISGTVNGDINVMGGTVNLNDTAVIHGSLTSVGGSINRRPNAQIDGEAQNRSNIPSIPRAPSMPRMNFGAILEPFMVLFRALALGALAILVYLFAGRPMERISLAAHTQPVVVGGIGLLSIFVVPALLLILGITIILLPVSLLGFLLLAIALVFGWLAMGLLTGRQIADWLHQTWSAPLAAGLGTLVLTLLTSLFNFIPCIGWLVSFVVGIMGLGAVIITQFGVKNASTGGFNGMGGMRNPSGRPSGSPAPAQPTGPAAPYDQGGYEPTDQYYAPHVVVRPGNIDAEPVPPVQVAPDLSFLNVTPEDEAKVNPPMPDVDLGSGANTNSESTEGENTPPSEPNI